MSDPDLYTDDETRTLKLKRTRKPAPVEVRFFRYVHFEPNSGCWLWDGSCDRKGYGQIRVASSGCGALRYASHISLEIAGRPLTPGMQACHRCDNPYCVNPEHLFPGTQLDNIHDCMAKGRKTNPPSALGKRHPERFFCEAGHPLTEENTYRYKLQKMCRTCRQARKVSFRLRQAESGLTVRGNPKR